MPVYRKLHPRSRHCISKSRFDLFRTGREYLVKRSFKSPSNGNSFRKGERILLMGEYNTADDPRGAIAPEEGTDIVMFRSPSGKRMGLCLPGDEELFCTKYLEWTGSGAAPETIIPGPFEDQKYVVSSPFRVGKLEFYPGEKLDFGNFTFELGKKLVTLNFSHDGRKEKLVLRFGTFDALDGGFDIRTLKEHLSSGDGSFTSW